MFGKKCRSPELSATKDMFLNIARIKRFASCSSYAHVCSSISWHMSPQVQPKGVVGVRTSAGERSALWKRAHAMVRDALPEKRALWKDVGAAGTVSRRAGVRHCFGRKRKLCTPKGRRHVVPRLQDEAVAEGELSLRAQSARLLRDQAEQRTQTAIAEFQRDAFDVRAAEVVVSTFAECFPAFKHTVWLEHQVNLHTLQSRSVFGEFAIWNMYFHLLLKY
jgi:hypothetical protein